MTPTLIHPTKSIGSLELNPLILYFLKAETQL